MTKYATDTNVSSERSRAEIERTLTRYGADQFLYGWDNEKAVVGFRMHGKMVRFTIPMPNRNDREFKETPTGRWRSEDSCSKAYEQAIKQRWRALGLVVKAKLEAVESGITTFETEFLPYFVLPNDRTVAEEALPALERTYKTGQPMALLPGPS